MKLVTISTISAAMAVVPSTAMAAIVPLAMLAPELPHDVVRTAFGNGHHAKKSQGAAVPKDPTPGIPDMHGATRESADKAYRQRYGF